MLHGLYPDISPRAHLNLHFRPVFPVSLTKPPETERCPDKLPIDTPTQISYNFPAFERQWLSGRASPCQGEGRGFESHLPLQEKLSLYPKPPLHHGGFRFSCNYCLDRKRLPFFVLGPVPTTQKLGHIRLSLQSCRVSTRRAAVFPDNGSTSQIADRPSITRPLSFLHLTAIPPASTR